MIAQAEGIELNDDHWKVVQYLRDQYKEHGQTPNFRTMLKDVAGLMPGCDSKALYDLFPLGPAKQGARIRRAAQTGQQGRILVQSAC